MSSAVQSRKSMKGQQYTELSTFSRNCDHISRSSLTSVGIFTWWWGCNLFEINEYNLVVKALPGMIAWHRKFRKPANCWICRIVALCFLLAWILWIGLTDFSIFSTGMHTTCLSMSISKPRKIMMVSPQVVLSRATGNLMLLQTSIKIATCSLHCAFRKKTNRKSSK